MLIDKTKDALSNVWALINLANNTAYTETSPGLVMGSPLAVTGRSDGHNTKVTVSADSSGTYQGSVDFFYTRLGLLQSNGNPPASWQLDPTTFSQSALLSQVISDLNLVASEVAFVGSLASSQPSIVLAANAGSLLYVGSVNIPLVWKTATASQTVDQLIPNAQLPGFEGAYTSVASVVKTQTLGGFDTVPQSPYVWSNQAVLGIPTTKQSTMVTANGMVWMCSAKTSTGVNQTTLYAFDPLDGSTIYSVNVSAYTNVSPTAIDLFSIAFVDSNGLLWLVNQSPNGTEAQIVRVDTTTGLIKDSIAPAAGTKLTVLNMTEDGTNDFVWVLSRDNSSGVVSLLKLDVVSGAVLTTYTNANVGLTGLATGDGLVYNAVNKRLWRGWNNGGIKSLTFITLNSSGDPSVSATTQVGSNAQAGSSILNAENCAQYSTSTGMEMAYWDFSVAGQQAISRYNGADGSSIARTAVTPPYTNPSTDWNIFGPLKYSSATDEYYVGVRYYKAATSSYAREVWAFKRLDPTQGRVVYTDDGTMNCQDFCVDANGALYAFQYMTNTGVTNVIRVR